MSKGIELIAAERDRQILILGYGTENHDIHEHAVGELARAGAAYVLSEHGEIPDCWPWPQEWWRFRINDRIRMLQKAGALIAAEIDRLAYDAHDAPAEEARP